VTTRLQVINITDNPSGRTVPPGMTRPVTEMSTRSVFWK